MIKRITEKAEELFSPMRDYFIDKLSKRNYINEEPLRSELFTSGQMEQYGKVLAKTHKLSSHRKQDQMLGRLDDNEKTLLEVRELLTEGDNTEYLITPGGEWLIDNFYLIEEQIRIAKRHLPKGYSENLPQLANEKFSGISRVYDIALQIISHSDGRIDLENLSNFVKAYQTITPLQMGELWAIPIMLRLALIENLRRLSAQLAIDRIDRNLANHWANRMIETAEKKPQDLIITIADMTRSRPPLVSAFVAQLSHQLKGKGPGLSLALNWVEQRLSESGPSSIELISAENQKQAAVQVSMRNSITSLRIFNVIDWRDFVETHSVVEQILRKDPAGIYASMDFPTRDRYRHVVEHISRKSKLSEEEVSHMAIRLCEEKAAIHSNAERDTHIGYYLVGNGLPETNKMTKIPWSFSGALHDTLKKNSFIFYFMSILFITFAISVGIYIKTRSEQTSTGLLILIFGLSLICASQLAITIVNFFSTLFVRPLLLSRMNFSETIPPECRTMVIIPVIINSLPDIDSMVEALEVRFLANRDENLKFGLLTDLADAPLETLPGDMALEKRARQGIEELNKKYGKTENDLFYLFHRPRCWNPIEKVWMGYERKRGKLSQMNALLRGKGEENFSIIVGNKESLLQVKYVITLDADTQLPRGTAWKLIATMAHPLNRAFYNEKKQRVTEGYGILQPRVTVSLPELTASNYARLHGNEPGIDPYTRATSDVYQDLFAEGSFIGKGIYDVDIFEKALLGKFPENRILSHDLLEGCYARSGLLSDVQLYEKYPSSYSSDVRRRARWIRGDWQIAAWFFPFVPGADRHWRKNPLSALSRWKIIDNIRRSLVPIALTLFIVLGWLVLDDPLFWTLAVSVIIVLPIFVTTIWNLFKKPKDVVFVQHVIYFGLNAGAILIKTISSLICLPHEAYYSLVSIMRSIWRMVFLHKKLLEWNPSAIEDKTNPKKLLEAYVFMWAQILLALITIVYLSIIAPLRLTIAAPILILWFVAPLIMWLLSRPLFKQASALTRDQLIFLHTLARKTWNYFEQFVVENDNWLPPDNFQEHPNGLIAHRTSPTNIGLYLLTNLSACDFGYISIPQYLKRTGQTIDTLIKMEKYRGHLYNWYDTLSLMPLTPKYISTVDSGNLAGYLLTLNQGLIETLNQGYIGPLFFEGLRDTLYVLIENVKGKNLLLLNDFKYTLEKACDTPPSTPVDVKNCMEKLSSFYSTAMSRFQTEPESSAKKWSLLLDEQIREALKSLQILAPWYLLPSAPPKFKDILDKYNNPSLNKIVKAADEIPREIGHRSGDINTDEEKTWLDSLENSLSESGRLAGEQISLIKKLSLLCEELADCDWDFLYDKSKNLLTIGYKPDEHQCDPSFYDLLASEARFVTFLGIAQGKLPEESWFALGRLVTNPGRAPVLLSWGGSMFEYLMPLLVMPTYENTLLDQTYKTAVQRQIEYGNQRGVPWGNSESGYNMVDINSNYQYHAFGTPGLGLKRGLGEDLVVAPYATILALMVEPEKACKNLELMFSEEFEGAYGFYEAIDYTPSRLQRGQDNTIIQSYMAHHEGMSLLALVYLLLNQPMQRRFEAEPQFRASLLLLQEKIPKATSYYAHTTPITDKTAEAGDTEVRVINTPHTPIPEVHLLSNGRYHVMITNAGGGYSRWKDIAVTRWREDGTCDNWGTFCYIRDLDNETFWSGTFQPSMKKVKNYEAAFSQSRVDFRGSMNSIETHTEIVVSPEDDIEMRRLNLTNHSGTTKALEITSYAEVVLASAASDLMQPAFSNLFVQTEIIQEHCAIICTRRPRSKEEQPPWMFHLMTAGGTEINEVSYETDRLEFIGRGQTTANPRAMNEPGPLSGRQGSVLDPIVAVRYKINLQAEQTVSIDMITGICDTREACLELIEKYQDIHHKDRVFELAWTHSQVVLRHINATETDAQLYGRLAGSIIFANSSLRADSSILIKNRRGQSDLWGYSISGDLPIILLQIEDQANVKLVIQVIQAHTYWRMKGLKVDLVIWNEDHGGYRQLLQNHIQSLIAAEDTDKPGGIFVRAADQISKEDRILFQTVSRVIISDSDGTLADHLNRKPVSKVSIPYLNMIAASETDAGLITPPKDLQFFNGMGGFSSDGRAYIIAVNRKAQTPAPWVNVIANPHFGTVISESGQAYTWAENAHEFRLSPWLNDPVCDPSGEAFYLRDEETGRFWSTTLLPRGGLSPYLVRHGMGHSVFEHIEEGIHSEMWVYVDIEETIKFTVLKISNVSGRSRRLSATGYIEWVLGDQRPKTAMHIFSELHHESGAIFARNPYNTEFSGRVSFFDTDDLKKTFTTDRTEFIGRNGSLMNPDGMHRVRLSGKLGGGLDPCAAIQIPFELEDGEEKQIIFRLGTNANINDAGNLAVRFRGSEIAEQSLQKVKDYWQHTLGNLQVETPDAAINILTNGWLTYQVLASRLWGRSGYYQSGGAFGFRDQLQDVLSLFHSQPELGRRQILLAASRQFKEGDVQHWWHPPTGRGVRTHCSDDYLWLPYVTTIYIRQTGDTGILDQLIPFLEGRLLNADEESYYDLPLQSKKSATLYDHCVKAIEYGFRYGEHGLPLMGTGDWNDGMDRVGKQGKGESVWLGFFLYNILLRFIDIAEVKNDNEFSARCKKEAETLKENIRKSGWDGEWYRRAYFDDGTPLGSSKNEECRIDSLSQSWAVISGAAEIGYAQIAINSAYKNLVHEKDRIIRLLEPAFDKSEMDPGYIKGYVPGVRENGGQYTHAALWLIIAFAKLGDNKRTWELLQMINPINHGRTLEEIRVYKVEPYVMAGDVYSLAPYTGHGGWTWYSGSASWMYKLITEFFLGLGRQGNTLSFAPCVPAEWESFKVHYRYKNTVYHISFMQKNTVGEMRVKMDGVEQTDKTITLEDDSISHEVEVVLFSGALVKLSL
jgi:cyclic beta-1,2-glucan synthetase